MRQFEAIIWDFGGVVTSSPFEAFARFEAENGLPADIIRRINATDPDSNAWALFERAEISADHFDDLFAAEAATLGHDIRGRDVLALLSGDVRPRVVAALDQVFPPAKGPACRQPKKRPPKCARLWRGLIM
jgi:putative hydrolase of the HAD superfamily